MTNICILSVLGVKVLRHFLKTSRKFTSYITLYCCNLINYVSRLVTRSSSYHILILSCDFSHPIELGEKLRNSLRDAQLYEVSFFIQMGTLERVIDKLAYKNFFSLQWVMCLFIYFHYKLKQTWLKRNKCYQKLLSERLLITLLSVY